jgi:5-amino-6-(5-phospho-D-ribitylamino)uracil phosphatase
MTPLRAAIFDFDETMIDLELQHAAADRALCLAMGSDFDELPASHLNASGRRIVDEIREMKEWFGWATELPELERLRRDAFDQACRESEISLLPGVESAVRGFEKAGLMLAITTSAVRESIEILLERVGLLDAFPVIIDGSEVEHPKPHPEPYLLTAHRLGVSPRECVVFEDSGIGVTAAKDAGAFCVAVRNPGAKTRQDLDAADLVLDSLEDLHVADLLANAEEAPGP